MKASRVLASRKAPPMGLSKRNFFEKLRTPGASKPWRSGGLADGMAEVTPNFGVVTVEGDNAAALPVPPATPLHLPSDYSIFHANRRRQVEEEEGVMAAGTRRPLSSSEVPRTARDIMRSLNRNELGVDSVGLSTHQMDREAALAAGQSARGGDSCAIDDTTDRNTSSNAVGVRRQDLRGLTFSSGEQTTGVDAVTGAALSAVRPDTDALVGRAPPGESYDNPLATIPIGEQLRLDVNAVNAVDADTKASLLKYLRTQQQQAESVRLPRNLTALFHRIMGYGKSLSSGEDDPLLAASPNQNDGMADIAGASRSVKEPTTLQAKRAYRSLEEKAKYGLLMEPFENDQFALENKLSVAGLKFERQFAEWSSMKVLENAPQQDMLDVRQNKSSVLLSAAVDFKIPKLDHDCCSGCGATFQSKDENQFGYARPSNVEHYVEYHSNMSKLRCEYGDRMAELQAHWEKNGRRVGEEWLDFMTQDEFQAIYRYRPTPFVCDRCFAISKKKYSLINAPLLSAPDFTEKLSALREQRCVIVLVCDITDFPGSMIYDLPGIISMNNPVILVLNKLDCLQRRKPGYTGKQIRLRAEQVSERYLRQWATDIAAQFRLPRHAIKSVVPVSAARGWNITKLMDTIEELSNMSLRRPHEKVLPTYFVGVSNVGKSSVINAIAHKLYEDVPPHPQAKKVYFTKTDAKGRESIHYRWHTPEYVHKAEMNIVKSIKGRDVAKLLTVSNLPGTTVATTAVRLALGGANQTETHIFDTPGLFPHWQVNSPLSLLDVRRSLHFKYRSAECFILKQGHTLCFGGVAAIDVAKAKSHILFMVYSSKKTRHGIIETAKADEFWAQQVGKRLVPPGSLEQIGDLRLTERKSYLFECYGRHRMRPKADIYICGLGWVAFCTSNPDDVVLRVRTLPGIVHGVREPLRTRDLVSRSGWPRLPPGVRVSSPKPSMNTFVHLTSGPVDLTKPAIQEVAPEPHHKDRPVADEPFEDLLQDLAVTGKI